MRITKQIGVLLVIGCTLSDWSATQNRSNKPLSVSGVVEKSQEGVKEREKQKEEAVPGVQISLGRSRQDASDLLGYDVTTDTGQFVITIPSEVEAGSAIIVSVENWIVVLPNVGGPGRFYLPNSSSSERLHVKVANRGDKKQLLSSDNIQSLLFERFFHFKKEGELSHLWRRNADVFGVSQNQIGTSIGVKPLLARTLLIDSKDNIPEASVLNHVEFIDAKSKELGIPSDEISAAINLWLLQVREPYQQGLAALYSGKYAEARDDLKKSMQSGGDPFFKYVILSRAEFELREYDSAEKSMSDALQIHPRDPILQENLNLIRQSRPIGAPETLRAEPHAS